MEAAQQAERCTRLWLLNGGREPANVDQLVQHRWGSETSAEVDRNLVYSVVVQDDELVRPVTEVTVFAWRMSELEAKRAIERAKRARLKIPCFPFLQGSSAWSTVSTTVLRAECAAVRLDAAAPHNSYRAAGPQNNPRNDTRRSTPDTPPPCSPLSTTAPALLGEGRHLGSRCASQ